MGVGDQFGVPFRVGLEVHIVTPRAVFGQQFRRFARQDADGNADFQLRQLPVQQVERIENPPEFRRDGRVAVAAGDVAESAHAVFIRLPRRVEHLFRRKQFVSVDSGVVVTALGAKAAILGADPGFGVQNRTGDDVGRVFFTHLVGQGNQVEKVVAADFLRDFKRLPPGQNASLKHFAGVYDDRIQHGLGSFP
ncbi:hypothetical protein SDC9_128641 [bioreactor metagenome]|uniref:Uncharacterized protein n=1 Tax=bioreactor metagenome TaxID=1076179 RepID=A0A645CXF5_9ZZZZ